MRNSGTPGGSRSSLASTGPGMREVMASVHLKARKPFTGCNAGHPGDANTPQEAEDGPLEFVPDLDVYLEHAMCSCNASDDNPY